MKSFGLSKRGLVREANEDKFHIDKIPFYILADGMGGHIAGEIASGIAIEIVKEYFLAHRSLIMNEVSLKDAIMEANRHILERIQAEPELMGMGTTILAAFIEDSMLFWSHVGDSRIYVYYRGTLKQVTIDHSMVNSLVAEGKISAAEASEHPSKNVITRAVGVNNNLTIDAGRLRLEKESMILMCSDGLNGMLTDNEIRDIMIANENRPKECVEALINSVYAAGAKDNVTAIVILNE